MLLPVLAAILVLTSGIAYGADLTLSWIDNSFGSAATLIERRLGSDPQFRMLTVVAPRVAFYVDSTVVAGQTYCYRALAYIDDNVSPYTDEACAVAVDRLNVRVGKTGTGAGTVSSAPAGIACGSTCSAVFPAGSAVVLSATPSSGSTFVGWSGGGCVGTQPCAVAGNDVVAVTANFSPAARPPATSPSSPPAPGTVQGSLSARCTVSGAEVGVSYAASCTVSGGSAPYSCAVVSGTLPSGLSLGGDCRVTGIPASAGTKSFTVRVSDAAGSVVNASGSVSVLPKVTITTSGVPGAVANRAFSTTLVATGGRAPYSWSMVGGALASGLALDPARGTIAGLPTTLGGSAFTVQVRDALGATSEQALFLAVNQVPLTVTCQQAPAEVGIPYSSACTLQGGLAPYACDVGAGAPPQGLTVNSNCTIAGTPAVSGSVSFTTRVRDSMGSVIQVPVSIQVEPHVAIATTVLPAGMLEGLFNTTLEVSGGIPPYTWSVVAGILPSGVGLNPVDGQIIGAPTGDGVSEFTIRVRDALGATFDQRYTLVVNYVNYAR